MDIRAALILLLAIGAVCPAELARSAPPQIDAQYQSYLAHIAAANSALRLHEAGDAKRWLNQAPGNHHSWEWRWLHHQSDTSVRQFKAESWSPVRADYSPDGSLLAVAGSDGKVRVLSGEELTVQREFQTGEQAVYAARFNFDGTLIATCNRDGNIAVWSAKSGDKIWEQPGGGQGLADIAWHPRGQQIAFCSWFRGPQSVLGTVSLWDAKTGQQTWKTEFGVKPVVVVKFSPDGSRLAAGTWDGIVGVWDSAAPDKPQELNFRDAANYSAIDDIAFSPDGARLAAASKNGSPRIWNLATGQIERDLRGHSSAVFSVAFAGDETLLSGGSDGVMGVWNTARGELAHRCIGHENRIGSIALRPTTREVATCSADRTIRIWNLADSGALEDDHRAKYVYGMALSRDGRLLATGGQTPTDVTVWDAAKRQPLRKLAGLEGSVNYLSFGPDNLLVGGNWNNDLIIWDAGTGETVRTLEKQNLGGVQQCAFSSNGNWIAASVRSQQIAIWDARTGKLIQKLPMPRGSWGLDFSADSSRLAAGDGTGVMRVFATDSWREEISLPGVESQSNAVKFSPDGRRVACGGENGRLVVFDIESKAVAHSAAAHSQRIWTLDFLADGSRLATGGADLKVKLWDVDSGQSVLTLSEFTEPVYNLVFSAVDDTLFVNGTVAQRAFSVPRQK